jgi:tetratricopeptide (TPR) repeat protein
MTEHPTARTAPPDDPAGPPGRAGALAATIGGIARRHRKRFGALPGVTAPVDLIAARHCVDILADRLKEDPTDPRRHVWFAEALQHTRRDIRTWARLRTVMEPSSLLVRTAVRGVTQLGEDGSAEDAETRLLRRAFAISASRVRGGEADPVVLHVLARVYLARGMPAEALRLAGQAFAIESDERADVLVTTARALRRMRRREDAARAAERAVDLGTTLGYDVLARLMTTDGAQLRRDPGRLIELRRKVRAEDRVRYAGAARSGAEIARAVKTAQWQKASTAFADAVGLAARAQRAVTKEPRP